MTTKTNTMRAVRLYADWDPRPGFKLGTKDVDKKQTYLGSRVWRNPRLKIEEVPIPKPGPHEVLIEVQQCGICGSDVHMAQADKEGYIFYPGLTGFPCTLGHELSGIVRDFGPGAKDKATNKPFKGGEWVCAEEMVWCGACQPCADGFPNHCERLDEIGFNINGAFTKYIVLPDRLLWSLDPLREKFSGAGRLPAWQHGRADLRGLHGRDRPRRRHQARRQCRHLRLGPDRPGRLRDPEARRRRQGHPLGAGAGSRRGGDASSGRTRSSIPSRKT